MAMALAQRQDHPHHQSLYTPGSHGRLLRIPGPIHDVQRLCELVLHFDQACGWVDRVGQFSMRSTSKTICNFWSMCAAESRFEDFLWEARCSQLSEKKLKFQSTKNAFQVSLSRMVPISQACLMLEPPLPTPDANLQQLGKSSHRITCSLQSGFLPKIFEH